MNALDQGIRIGTTRVGRPHEGATAGSIADFIAGLAGKMRARRAAARAERETGALLLGMSDRDLRDIGLTRDQWNQLFRDRGL
jgi:uncharacterized protein YjiS (DUF1127 family)